MDLWFCRYTDFVWCIFLSKCMFPFSLVTDFWSRSAYTSTFFSLILIGLRCGFLGSWVFGGFCLNCICISNIHMLLYLFSYFCSILQLKCPGNSPLLHATMEMTWNIFVSQCISFSPTNSVPFLFLGLSWRLSSSTQWLLVVSLLEKS